MSQMPPGDVSAHCLQLAGDPDWWRGAVIYQIYPRSFQDTNGDGVGDLRGMSERLEHVAALGVDAIWISPFFRSPMKDFGYDVEDYCAVDPLFGSLEDFDQLVDKAHRLGIRVLIDQVLSHTSDHHAWFAESRMSRHNAKSDWYVWADPKPDGSPPNNWLSIFGGSAWHWDSRRQQYYLHNFLVAQPDLNFHNPEVQDALLSTVRFWLDRGVDGFRLDTVNFYFHSESLKDNPPLPPEQRNASLAPSVNPYNYQDHVYDKSRPENLAFLKRFRALLDEYPNTMSVGEIGDSQRPLELMAEYTEGSDRIHVCYTFDFLSADFSPGHFRKVIARFEEQVGDGAACWAFSNHDVERHVSRWHARVGGDWDALAKLSVALLVSLRGSVCIYQGEELGLPEAELLFEDLVDPYGIEFWPSFKGRDGCRTPMAWERDAEHAGFSEGKPWLPVPHAHLDRAVDTQAGVAGSVLECYRDAIALRRAHPVLATGSMRLLPAGDEPSILAIVRECETERLLCVFNMSSERASWTLPGGGVAEPLADNALPAGEDGRTLMLDAFGVWIGQLADA